MAAARKEKKPIMSCTSSWHITKLKQSIFAPFNIYGTNIRTLNYDGKKFYKNFHLGSENSVLILLSFSPDFSSSFEEFILKPFWKKEVQKFMNLFLSARTDSFASLFTSRRSVVLFWPPRLTTLWCRELALTWWVTKKLCLISKNLLYWNEGETS